MPRATRFPSGLQTGKNTGVPSESTIGNVLQVQEVDVSAGGKRAQLQLPPNAYPVEMYTLVKTADASAQGVQVYVGTSANQTRYATFLTSASNNYRTTTVSGKAWAEGFGSAASNVVMVDVTAAFVLSGYDATVSIVYEIKDN